MMEYLVSTSALNLGQETQRTSRVAFNLTNMKTSNTNLNMCNELQNETEPSIGVAASNEQRVCVGGASALSCSSCSARYWQARVPTISQGKALQWPQRMMYHGKIQATFIELTFLNVDKRCQNIYHGVS
jgi:hypothetical protein